MGEAQNRWAEPITHEEFSLAQKILTVGVALTFLVPLWLSLAVVPDLKQLAEAWLPGGQDALPSITKIIFRSEKIMPSLFIVLPIGFAFLLLRMKQLVPTAILCLAAFATSLIYTGMILFGIYAPLIKCSLSME